MTISTQTDPVGYPFDEPSGLSMAPEFADARQATGMIRVQTPYGEPAWLAARYEDARFVLADRRFSRAVAKEHDEPRLSAGMRGEGIMSMDPPDHTRLRTLVAKAFTGNRVEQMRPRIRELAAGLVDDMIATGPPVDLVESFALPLPVAVICELLGVPVADRPKFRAWSDALLSTSRITAEQFGRIRIEFRAYLTELIERRRAEPRDDLMTALIEARDERDRLTEIELIDLCRAVLTAGHETTATQIPNFVHVLLERPEQWAALRAAPDLIPAAVEELTRFVPIASNASFARYATEDVEVGGVLVRAGEPVLVAFTSANRDETRFAEPDELRFDREDNQHIGFGHGVHHCLGAQLARAELQEALRVLLARLPGLHHAGEVVWKTEMLVRGARAMPVGW